MSADIVERLEAIASREDQVFGAMSNGLEIREAAAEIGRLRVELAVANECLGEERAANVLRTPAPAMPNGVEASPANCRERLRLEGRPYPRSGCAHCKLGGLTGCPYEKGAHNSGRAADNRDAAGVVERALAYLHPHLDAGTFAAPDWAIQLASILTGGDGCGTPAAVPAGEAVATVVGYDSWHRVAVDWHKLDMEPGTKLYTTPPAPVQAAPQEGEGYYLASFKHKANNGEVMWWKGDNAGYSPDLEQAGIYTELVPGYHDSEDTVPVPVAFLAGLRVRRTVDPGDSLNHMFWSAKTLRAALQHRGDSQEVGRG